MAELSAKAKAAVKFNTLLDAFIDALMATFRQESGDPLRCIVVLKNNFTMGVEYNRALPVQKWVQHLAPFAERWTSGDRSMLEDEVAKKSILGDISTVWAVADESARESISAFVTKLMQRATEWERASD